MSDAETSDRTDEDRPKPRRGRPPKAAPPEPAPAAPALLSHRDVADHLNGKLVGVAMDAGRDFHFARSVLGEAQRRLPAAWRQEQADRRMAEE